MFLENDQSPEDVSASLFGVLAQLEWFERPISFAVEQYCL